MLEKFETLRTTLTPPADLNRRSQLTLDKKEGRCAICTIRPMVEELWYAHQDFYHQAV